MRKSSDVVTILLGVVLFLIVLGILVVLASSKKNPQGGVSTVTSTVEPTVMPTSSPLNGKPAVYYNDTAENKLLSTIQKKPALTQNDRVAKATILSLLPDGEESGVLYTNSLIQIDYTHSADIFQVEILTTDISSAKSAANVWFRSHGISQNAICEMPVEFYLNYDIANQLRQSGGTFNPLGNGC